MISVIVPVYKAEKVITRCIESVIVQKYKDWELILVDDGSPDRSGEICDEYALKDERIMVVHQPNEGVSRARNHGIEEAHGEYVCFIDSDDYVASSFLSDFSLDGADFEIQGMSLQFPDSTRNHAKYPQKEGKFSVCELLSMDEATLDLLNGPCCKLYKLSKLRQNEISFPVGLSYGEDSVFVLSYLLQCDTGISHSVSNYYYTHDDSASLSSRLHDGKLLMHSVLEDYNIFQQLSQKNNPLPLSYIHYYRDYKSLIFYNAIHCVLLSKDSTSDKIAFLQSLRSEAERFFRQSPTLPVSYRLIKIMRKLLSASLIVFVYPLFNLAFRRWRFCM